MNTDQIYMSFWQIINWAGERNRIAKSYGTDGNLYITEIHTIAIIGEKPGILQRELCDVMGLTKGRVSVIISNLEKKGFVIKGSDSNNNKELPLRLTDLGETAFENHEKQEEERNSKINELLSTLNQDELNKFNDILAGVLKILKK
jgi:DNA-binding MarR family transcriptional regulator